MTRTQQLPPEIPIPSNTDAEAALLGCLLIDNSAATYVAGVIAPDDFYQARLGYVYEAIVNLNAGRNEIDTLTIMAEIERLGHADVVHASDVYGLINAVPSAVHLHSYIDIVQDMSTRRKLIRDAVKATKLAYDLTVENPVAKVAALFDQTVRAATRGSASLRDLMPDYLNDLDAAMNRETPAGLATGYPGIDAYTRLMPGDLIVLAARPSMGKTALALNIALHTAKRAAANVAIFSLEMNTRDLMHRLLGQQALVDNKLIADGRLTDEEYTRVQHASGVLADLSIYIDENPQPHVSHVRRMARSLAVDGLDLIVIDYLQLMATEQDNRNRVQEISAITRALKLLARELQVPIIAISQLSRGTEQRQDKRPVLSDLRDSGAIEQDADVVLFVYREKVYDANTSAPNSAEIIIAKNRNGATGKVDLHYTAPFTLFSTPHREKLQ